MVYPPMRIKLLYIKWVSIKLIFNQTLLYTKLLIKMYATIWVKPMPDTFMRNFYKVLFKETKMSFINLK